MVGWPDTRFLELSGARAPIVQAPMAGAGGVALAVAAMRGGAVGSLPCAMLTPAQVRAQVAEVRAQAQGPLNLNFFCHHAPAEADEAGWHKLLAPYYAELGVGPPDTPPPLRGAFDAAMAEVVEEVRPELVSFHFGFPRTLWSRVLKSGAKVLASATTLREARTLRQMGCDAVIVQGWEAGGHASYWLDGNAASHMGLFALLPQVVDAVDVPVIAAGGIADARGIAAAFALGASVVQIGTAYLHCPESLITPMHRAALTSEHAEHTQLTNLFSGGLARGLRNRLMDELGAMRAEVPPFPYGSIALAELRRVAEAAGNPDFSPMWAGQAAGMGKAEAARDLTERLAFEALALLES